MANFLIFQAQSTLYEVGLFSNTHCIAFHQEDKKYSSRNLIPAIDSLLQQNNLHLTTIDALGVNQGPGPFTGLRIAIATANGLSFAAGIPVIGHNSLEALLLENNNNLWPLTIALLNAYNNDLYYGLYTAKGLEIGCKNSTALFCLFKEQFKDLPIRFLGNGAMLHKESILSSFKNAFIPNPLPAECSLRQLAFMTQKSYEAKKGLEKFLLPYYLKDIAYTSQI